MKKTVLALGIGMALGAAGVAIAGRPADDKGAYKLQLKSITPSSVVRLLTQPSDQGNGRLTSPLLPEGIKQINPDDPRGTLTLRGDTRSVNQVRELVKLIDLGGKGVRMPIRIWRMESTPESSNPARQLVATAVTQTVNNIPAEVLAVGDVHVFQIRLIPHINGDRHVTLGASFASTPLGVPLAKFTETPHATRVAAPGKTISLSATFIQKRQDSKSGLPGPFAEPRFGYLLEVTPEMIPPSNIRVPIW